MKTIWKFYVLSSQYTLMPEGAKILSAAGQRGDTVIWAQVDPTAREIKRRLDLYETGQRMPDDPGTFIGTVLHDDGDCVVHVFDAGPA